MKHIRQANTKPYSSNSLAFEQNEWATLKTALLHHVSVHEIANTLQTEEGVHHVVEGALQTPDGRNPNVRSVWAIDTGSEVPRFITAYPLEKG